MKLSELRQIIKEEIRSIREADAMIKNPSTNNMIKVSSALEYPKDTAVYKAAILKTKKNKPIATPINQPVKKVATPNEPNKIAATDNKYLEKFKEYKLSRLPIGIPEKDVKVNTSGDVDSHWILKWVDPKTGKQLTAYTNNFLKKNAEYKWSRIQTITDKDIDNIKVKADKALQSKDEKEQQVGAILSIISNTGLRIGSRSGFDETQNRGVSTLHSSNIKIQGDRVQLEFTGKSYKNNTAVIKNATLAKYLTQLRETNKGEDFIFNKVNDDYVRDYFHANINKSWKIKDMRTFVATNMAKKILFNDKTPPPPIPKVGVKKLVQAKLTNVYKLVSDQLNNSPTMAKNSYIHPEIINGWLKSINVQL
jgi:hypothetical protein